MDTDKITIKNDMDLSQITNIETLSYLLSVFSVSIGGNLWIFHLEQKDMGNAMILKSRVSNFNSEFTFENGYSKIGLLDS